MAGTKTTQLAVLTLSALLVAWLSSCSSGGGSSGSRGAGTSGQLGTSSVNFGSLELRAGDGQGAVDRAGVLIAADRYQEPSWSITHVARNSATVRGALVGSAGFDANDLTELSGDDVHHDAIRSSIAAAAARISAPDGVLVIYHTGHGFVDQNGTPQYFTRYTREKVDGGFDPVVSRDQLARWINEAVAAGRQRGSTIKPVLLVDACRTRVMGPPPRATMQRLDLWEIHGTREGRFAEAPSDAAASPFTAALSESLGALADLEQDIDLARIFGDIQQRMRTATGGRQEPELIGPEQAPAPVLLRPGRTQMAVRVVDALSGSLIPGAELRIDSREPVALRGEDLVGIAPGPHAITVSANGYLRHSAEVTATNASGQSLVVQLSPDVVVISGQLSQAVPVQVAVRGVSGAVRDGYHRMRTVADGRGRFQLLVPAVTEGSELVLASGGDIIKRVPLPTAADRYRFQTAAGGAVDGIRTLDLGTVVVPIDLQDGAAARLAAGAEATAGLGAPRWVTEPERRETAQFDARIDANEWDQAMRLLEAGRASIAADLLHGLRDRGNDEAVQQWLAIARIQVLAATEPGSRAEAAVLAAAQTEGEYGQEVRRFAASRNLEAAWDAAVAGQGQRVIDLFRSTGTPPGSRAVRTYFKRQVATYAQLIQVQALRAEWIGILDALVHLPEGSGASDLVEEVAPLALRETLVNGIRAGVERGEWSMADRALTGLDWLQRRDRNLWEDINGLADLVQTATEERIPMATRGHYTAAQSHFADGDLTAAHDRYLTALDGANDHYRGLIFDQLRHLRPQLYNRHLNAGLEAEAAGQLAQAATSYRTARQYSDRAAYHFQRLTSRYASDPDIQAIVGAYRRYHAAEDAALERARADGLPAHWQAYLNQHPAGVAVDEAREAILAFVVAATQDMDETQRGQLSATDPTQTGRGYVDTYRIPVVEGQSVDVEMNGSFDTYVFVDLPGSTTPLWNDDYGGRNTRSVVANARVTQTGIMTIRATSYRAGMTGSYTLRIERNASRRNPDDLLAAFMTTDLGAGTGGNTTPRGNTTTNTRTAPRSGPTVRSGQLAVGQSYAEQLSASSPVDSENKAYREYTVDLPANSAHLVGIENAAIDVKLWVTDPSGTEYYNDDWSGRDRSLVLLPAGRAGSYRIRVGAFTAGETGAYRLRVQPFSAGQRLPVGRPYRINFNNNTASLWGGRAEVRYFDMRGGEDIRVHMTTNNFDGYLQLLTPTGVTLSNDDFGDRRNSRIELPDAPAGRYLIVARPLNTAAVLADGAHGMVTLTVNGTDAPAPTGRLQVGRSSNFRLTASSPVESGRRVVREMINLPEGRYGVHVSSSDLDPGVQVRFNGLDLQNEYWHGANGYVEFFTTGGQTEVIARGPDQATMGEMTISVTSISHSFTRIASGQPATVSLNANAPQVLGRHVRDFTWEVETTGRAAIEFSTTGLDGYLWVQQSDGSWLNNDDWGGSRQTSRIELNVTAGQKYLIRATTFAAGATGSGTLRVGPR